MMNDNIHPFKNIDFQFSFPMRTKENQHHLKVPIVIPLNDSVPELVQRLVSSLKLPPYIEEGNRYRLFGQIFQLLNK